MSEVHPPSRFAELRKRKAAGGPVALHRSSAELQRIASLPLSERSAAEKEACAECAQADEA